MAGWQVPTRALDTENTGVSNMMSLRQWEYLTELGLCHSFDLSSGVLFKRIVDLVCISAGVKVWSVSVYAGMHGLIDCHRVSCMDWYSGGVGHDIFCGLHWGCLLCGVWCVGCESC